MCEGECLRQGRGVGEADVLAGGADEAARDVDGVLAALQHPREPVHLPAVRLGHCCGGTVAANDLPITAHGHTVPVYLSPYGLSC